MAERMAVRGRDRFSRSERPRPRPVPSDEAVNQPRAVGAERDAADGSALGQRCDARGVRLSTCQTAAAAASRSPMAIRVPSGL